MKRILICGSNGLLGQRVAMMLSTQDDYEVLNTSIERSFVFDNMLLDYTQLDITNRNDTKSLIASFQPNIIINTAAITDVDWCETNKEQAWKVNVLAVENLVEAARKVNAKLIHISSDYIFDGKNGPYDEEAKPNPISYYGKTKLASENAIKIADIPYVILRTNVLYGIGINVKQNFVTWVINNLQKGNQISIVEDQYGNPTYVGDLAVAVLKAFELNKEGIFNIGGSEYLNRYEFALKIADVFGYDRNLIKKIKTHELNQKAPRPLKSGLITLKAETQLAIKFLNVTEGLSLVKRELKSYRMN